MADPYIDPEETQAYGLFAREQMAGVCLGMVPAFDGAIQYCIAEQKKADVAMKAALDAHPAKPPTAADEAAVGEARDAIVRFGNYLGSIKGKPVELSVFFGRDVPSVFARRRMVKLVAAPQVVLGEDRRAKKLANLRDHKAHGGPSSTICIRACRPSRRSSARRAWTRPISGPRSPMHASPGSGSTPRTRRSSPASSATPRSSSSCLSCSMISPRFITHRAYRTPSRRPFNRRPRNRRPPQSRR